MPTNQVHGACTIFNSAMHENRPVVFAGAGGYLHYKAQLLDYTLANTWEESKHASRLMKIMHVVKIM